MNQCADISFHVHSLHSLLTIVFYSGISFSTLLALLTPTPKNKRDSRCFVSVNRLPCQPVWVWAAMLLFLLRCVCVCVHVFYAVCVVCACAVNKGAAERWLSPRDLQAPRILHLPRLMTKLSSSFWAGTGWHCRQRQTRHGCLDPTYSHPHLTRNHIQNITQFSAANSTKKLA